MAKRLGHEGIGCAAVHAHLLRAGLAPRASEEAVDHLRHAIADADANDMALCAAAARDRLGRLVGGDDGAAPRARAARYVVDEGISEPDRVFEAAVPGVLASG